MRYRDKKERTFGGRIVDILILSVLLLGGYYYLEKSKEADRVSAQVQQLATQVENNSKQKESVATFLKKEIEVHQGILHSLETINESKPWNWKNYSYYDTLIFKKPLLPTIYPTYIHTPDSVFSPQLKAAINRELPQLQQDFLQFLDDSDFWQLADTRKNLRILQHKMQRWVAVEKKALADI